MTSVIQLVKRGYDRLTGGCWYCHKPTAGGAEFCSKQHATAYEEMCAW